MLVGFRNTCPRKCNRLRIAASVQLKMRVHNLQKDVYTPSPNTMGHQSSDPFVGVRNEKVSTKRVQKSFSNATTMERQWVNASFTPLGM